MDTKLMDTKLIAAFACAAALALGACSGGGPATPAAPGPATTDPDADGRTEDQRTFDTALDNAEKALADARALVTAAERAARAAGTDAARTAAQMDIDEARTALGRAVAAAKALDAPSGDFERIGAAAIQVDKAEAAEDEDEAKLRAAEGSTGWAGSSALVIGKEILRPAPALTAVRRPRRNADGTDAATLLKDADIPAVMYDAGRNQIVMADGQGSSGDRLRMRGIPVVSAGNTGLNVDLRRFLLFGRFADSPRPYLDPVGGGNNGGEPKLVAGLRITPSGLVVDLGGKGAPGIDLRLPSAWDNNQWASFTGNGHDLTLDFGPPAASPEGNAEHYWNAALMPTPEHLEDHGSVFKDGERVLPVGAYAMRLSNHAGLDTNLEDPDDPAASAEDDVNHYLSYAAYGHMEFRYSLGGSATIPSQRTFPFHVGYDAFKDEAGMKTTDIADADKIAKGTFKGRTMATQFRIVTLGLLGRYPSLTDASYLRLRGDIELTATISGTAADNKISGKIKNLESWDAKGFWEDYARIAGDLDLQETAITAAGSFAGVVDTASFAEFAEGGYKGNFYGPPASLEAAGIWYLQDGDHSTLRDLSIVGSFGAALVREDGVWGVARRGGG